MLVAFIEPSLIDEKHKYILELILFKKNLKYL